jgi:hypothetical protein
VTPSFLTSPRLTRSMPLLRLRSTSLWSAFRPSLKVCWSYLIPVRLVVLQATTKPCLHYKPLDLLFISLMFAFVRSREDFFLFLSPCTLHELTGAMYFLRLDTTLSQPLRLHVDRGLERHGYPWVPTHQGPRGPCRVDLTCQKPRRPASGPGDLIHNPSDLGRPRTTSSRLQKTCQACDAIFSPRLRHDAASRSEDHGILSVITEESLSNL